MCHFALFRENSAGSKQYSLEQILHPVSYTQDTLDIRICFFLHFTIPLAQGKIFSINPDNVQNVLYFASNFAAQLHYLGNWQWAVFIYCLMLSLHRSQNVRTLKFKS